LKTKHILLLAAVLTLALSPPAGAAQPADEAALKARADEFVAAWDKDDGHGLAAIFAPDGDLINPSGRVAKGRAEIEKLFTEEHAGVTKGTHYNILGLTNRFIGQDAAIQDWEAEVTGMKGPDGSALPPLKHHVTVVCVKKDGKWWVVAARPAVPLPPPGPPAK
jgi:uncharacterized protein (TIGR02246 family)